MLFRATILAFAGLASACVQQPTGALGGNPIGQPTLNQIVPVGKPFTITWNPTTAGTVSIVLLRGPSENVVPIDCLAESIPNSGTFSWTPSTSLVADVTHYGLQIIVTGTGQFQYSTQFGISNAAGPSSASSSAAASITSKAASTSASGSASATSGIPVTQISDGQVQVPTSSASITRPGSSISISTRPTNATTTASTSSSSSSSARLTTTGSSTRSISAAPSVTVASTGALHNTTILLPTGPVTVPSSLRTSATANATRASPIATSTPLSANPNAASKAFAAGGMLSLVGMVVVLLI
ncbi:hypothetical protein MMC31_005484 [Peltigera leucophlebia]|nr:hypothetical protein [Peltigera leucophlebia]